MYEYKMFRPYPEFPDIAKGPFEEDALNELAADGWRVAHVLPSRTSTAVLLLERHVEVASEPMAAFGA